VLDGQEAFKVLDPHYHADLVLRERPKEEKGYLAGDGICEASCTRPVTERLADEAREGGTLSAKKGVVTEVFEDLGAATDRALRIILWRRGGGGHPDPIRYFGGFFWSLDGADWKPVDDTVRLEIGLGIPFLKWSDALATSAKQLIQDGQFEPLAHELLREAIALKVGSARSAIVLGVTAAEVGFKQAVVQLAPQTQWLLENLASPPLVKMLREYLPKLPRKYEVPGQQRVVPEALLKELEKSVTLRNEIVHGGRGDLKTSTVASVMQAVHDVLYLLDFYCGADWAIKNVSVETFKGLTET
jgi:hypothetical protein